jgi:hypothetical protein
MNEWVLYYYRKLRAEGLSGTHALRVARVQVRWEDLEERGLARLLAEPEDHFWGDDFDFSGHGGDRYRKDMARIIERDGYWVWFAQWRKTEDSPWEYADIIGGIVGNDLNWHRFDLWESAIDALDAEFQHEAGELAVRATYAGVSP